MAGETKVSNTVKTPKSGDYTFRRVTKRRKLYGEIRYYPDGSKIYWAIRKPEEIFLELNAWALDRETISVLKCYGIKTVGVAVSNGDRYTTTIEKFSETPPYGEAVPRDYSRHVGRQGKFGAAQWYLPIPHWHVEYATTATKAAYDASLAKMIMV